MSFQWNVFQLQYLPWQHAKSPFNTLFQIIIGKWSAENGANLQGTKGTSINPRYVNIFWNIKNSSYPCNLNDPATKLPWFLVRWGEAAALMVHGSNIAHHYEKVYLFVSLGTVVLLVQILHSCSPECLIVTLTTWVISNVNKHDCKTNQTNALLLLVFYYRSCSYSIYYTIH